MYNDEEWNEFLQNLYVNAVNRYRKSEDYAPEREREARLHAWLSANLTADQKTAAEEGIFAMGVAAEREAEVVYRQGMRDCVWMLKHLGVLA